MKKLGLIMAAVLACGVLANAQPAQKEVKKEDGKAKTEFAQKREDRRGAMRDHFKAKMEEEKGLHDKYAAAKTDAEKAAVEKEINAKVSADTDREIKMFEDRLKESKKQVEAAEKRFKDIKKDKKNINTKKAEAIKEGKFGPRAMKENCDDGKCPFMPKDGKRGEFKGRKGEGFGHKGPRGEGRMMPPPPSDNAEAK
ncbi:hypothetical protein AAIR98_000477 [Elusimicrobium simillimum]|uniref:hypothetical protein n=1 Tax=Elusimicrobium simillimum TaxID=3143438 RepID=UPI003C6F6F38